MPTKAKHSLQWIHVLLAGWLLAACAAQPKPAPSVSFMIFGDPAEQAAFKSVVDGFHATTSAVHVEIIAVPSQSDYMARLAADLAAGTPPDVFLLNYRRMTQFYNAGTLEALGPRLQASAHLSEEQYYPTALDAFRSAGGTLVCIPQNISSQAVYYNKDMFDAAGMPYPDPNWDWEAFRQTAVALTQADRDGDGEPDQYGLGLEPRLIRTAAFIWQNGGELVDNPAQPARLALDAPEALGAIEFMMSLSLKDQVVPNKTAEMVQSHGDRFVSGNIAMYVDSRRLVPTMREVAKFNWDVAPLPRGKQQATVLHSDGYCLAKASKVQDAAWTFIEFAMGEEGQKRASQLGRTVPSLKSVAESPAYLDPTKPPAHAAVWLDAMAYLHPLPCLENWVAIERTADTEFELVYLGLQPLSTAIENVQRQSRQGFVPIRP